MQIFAPTEKLAAYQSNDDPETYPNRTHRRQHVWLRCPSASERILQVFRRWREHLQRHRDQRKLANQLSLGQIWGGASRLEMLPV